MTPLNHLSQRPIRHKRRTAFRRNRSAASAALCNSGKTHDLAHLKNQTFGHGNSQTVDKFPKTDPDVHRVAALRERSFKDENLGKSPTANEILSGFPNNGRITPLRNRAGAVQIRHVSRDFVLGRPPRDNVP